MKYVPIIALISMWPIMLAADSCGTAGMRKESDEHSERLARYVEEGMTGVRK